MCGQGREGLSEAANSTQAYDQVDAHVGRQAMLTAFDLPHDVIEQCSVWWYHQRVTPHHVLQLGWLHPRKPLCLGAQQQVTQHGQCLAVLFMWAPRQPQSGAATCVQSGSTWRQLQSHVMVLKPLEQRVHQTPHTAGGALGWGMTCFWQVGKARQSNECPSGRLCAEGRQPLPKSNIKRRKGVIRQLFLLPRQKLEQLRNVVGLQQWRIH
mmetsp:Transcript_30521/g.88724  ORF Transcript_30521/g.88724 Transcript_30521/m.88724 type:complete len:210 (+) Transcript_30521:3694-4323(+)